MLANERTLLAWVRTALAMQAGGFALFHISSDSLIGRLCGIGAVLFGGLVALVGYRRFRAAENAIRNHRLPPPGKGPALEVALVVLIAVCLATAAIFGLI